MNPHKLKHVWKRATYARIIKRYVKRWTKRGNAIVAVSSNPLVFARYTMHSSTRRRLLSARLPKVDTQIGPRGRWTSFDGLQTSSNAQGSW
jgi:hypothetical protein